MKISIPKLIVYDFDGVMTDNTIYLDQNGLEMARVNRSDGLGVQELKKLGYIQIIVSTESNPIVQMRGNKLNIPVFYNVKNKKEVVEKFCYESKINLDDVLFIGNDINDLEVMKSVGTTACPSDAYSEVLEISDIKFNSKGGSGVVRELFSILNK